MCATIPQGVKSAISVAGSGICTKSHGGTGKRHNMNNAVMQLNSKLIGQNESSISHVKAEFNDERLIDKRSIGSRKSKLNNMIYLRLYKILTFFDL